MKILKEYLSYIQHEQITGYFNYMEDRMKIMQKHNVGMSACFNRTKKITDKFKRGLSLYNCEIGILNRTIEQLSSAKDKCNNTQFPEKCEQFYDQLVPKFQWKIKFNTEQINNIKRKAGMIKY